jgi:hypothetical protein
MLADVTDIKHNQSDRTSLGLNMPRLLSITWLPKWTMKLKITQISIKVLP